MSTGWECPRCGRVLAPWVFECPCYQTMAIISTNYTIRTDKCSKICKYKNYSGYCMLTACANPYYDVDPDYGMGDNA